MAKTARGPRPHNLQRLLRGAKPERLGPCPPSDRRIHKSAYLPARLLQAGNAKKDSFFRMCKLFPTRLARDFSGHRANDSKKFIIQQIIVLHKTFRPQPGSVGSVSFIRSLST